MRHPIQPVYLDKHGTARFKENEIVSHLLKAASAGEVCDLNRIACMDFTQDDREQFHQLIGYSVSGFGDLSEMSDDLPARANARLIAAAPAMLEALEEVERDLGQFVESVGILDDDLKPTHRLERIRAAIAAAKGEDAIRRNFDKDGEPGTDEA